MLEIQLPPSQLPSLPLQILMNAWRSPASAFLAPVPTVLGPSGVSALLALSSLTVDTTVLVSVVGNISKCLFQSLQFNLASINHEGSIGPTDKSYPSLPVRTQADGLEAEGLPYQVFQPSENDLCHSKRTLIQKQWVEFAYSTRHKGHVENLSARRMHIHKKWLETLLGRIPSSFSLAQSASRVHSQATGSSQGCVAYFHWVLVGAGLPIH